MIRHSIKVYIAPLQDPYSEACDDDDDKFSSWRWVYLALCHPRMRWVRWYPFAFLTDNCGWATRPRLLSVALGRFVPAILEL